MTKKLFFTLFLNLLLLTSVSSFAETVPMQGKWEDNGNRQPDTRPVFSIEGNTLYLYFPKALNGVNFCISDSHEQIVYEGMISCEADEIFAVPIYLESGEKYQFALIHTFGTLFGNFIVN